MDNIKCTLKLVALTMVAGLAAGGTTAWAAPDLSKLPPAAKQTGVTFAKDIHPLFEASCVRCHGQDRPKGGLRLDTLESILKGSKDGKVLVAGNSEKSKIVIAVAQIDPEFSMPPKPRQGRQRGPAGGGAGGNPPGNGGPGGPRGNMGPPAKPLTPEQVGLVRAWIDQGAK
jgi:hypothetical protein